MRRYEIRNEYGFGDPELCGVVDKDDPESLLDAVAMSALVGLLRQLADLSQFAAEIFHDLHEEVMATAARGHALTARVQQLEAEFPFIEKACLSQTNHSPFFTNLGVDWHSNSHAEQNLVTRGDLPRFVMDSYEECRGPPRLFLLDKFDVAGAGACLKRYTDPSFFKVDATSSEIPTAEVQREKKVRKAKKQASRWRNGETTEVAPASHAKLHELFLEERVENGHSHPARVVKLKRRQLNGSLFIVTPGKSYMEKFVETPSPENKMVCADSVTPPLKLTLDDSSEAVLELHEVGVVSPVEKSAQGKETTISLGNELVLLKSYMDEDHKSSGEIVDRAIVNVPGPMTEVATDESLFTSLKTGLEEELTVDGDAKIEGILIGALSDDMNSEIDNYMDALATMESEMETDYEYKNDQALLNVEKCGMDTDANQENLEVQGKFSGSQSMVNSSLSYDGDSLVQIGHSNSSSSDCLCNSAENLPSDGGEEVAELSPFENHEEKIVDLPTDYPHMLLKARGTESDNLVTFNDAGIKEDKIHDSLDVPSSSCPADLKAVVTPLVPVGNAPCEVLSGCISHDSRLLITSRSGMDLADSSVVTSDVQDLVFSESHPVQKRNEEERNVSSESLTHSSLLVESMFENKCGCESASEVQEVHVENLVKGKIVLPLSIISPLEGQLPCPDSQVDSGVTFSPCSSDAVQPDYVDNAINPPMIVTGANLGLEPRLNALEADISEEFDDMDATVHVSLVELESVKEFRNLYSEEKGDLEETSGTIYSKEIREVSREVDERIKDVAPSTEVDSTVPSHIVDSEKYGESSSKLVVGDAMAFEHRCNTLGKCKFYPSDEPNELPRGGDATESVTVSTDADDDTGNVVGSSSDVIPLSSDHIDQDSLSGLKFQLEERFSSEPVSPECLGELNSLEEVNQEVIVLEDLGSTSYKSVSDVDYSRPNVDELVPESFLNEQTWETLHCSEDTETSATALSNSDLKLDNYNSECTATSCDVLGSPLTNVPLTESSSKLPSQLRAEQLTANDVHTGIGGASSDSVNNDDSSSSHQLLEFQIDQIVVQSLKTSEQSPELLNLQPEQIEVRSHVVDVTSLDGSVDSVLEDLRSQEFGGTKPTSIPFNCVFPSPGIQAEATCINLEEMPPLPPLPPMQWRMGKVPSAPLALPRECSDQSWDKSSLTQPATSFVFPSSDNEILQSPLPKSHVVLDSQELQDASPESLANSCQPTLFLPCVEVRTIVENAFGEEAHCPLEEAQYSNQSLTLPEVSNDREEHGFLDLDEDKQPDTTTFSAAQVPDLEPTYLVRDPVPSENLRSSPKASVEIQKSQNMFGEELTAPYSSAELPTHLEHQHQYDLVDVQQETLWSLNTLALPPTYGITKPNGNKLPRPRNPLIDAVAAHDKSKLRKVAEQVQPQIVPKLEETDSLLEQIRAKSFNLKPATMTRPSIQGMQGPKTNLKVAAILEKANAIRQALAGSDEDDDSDNWSDS